MLLSFQEVPEQSKESPGGPWKFCGLLPLFDPPRHDSAETIRKALNLGVCVKMITGKWKLLICFLLELPGNIVGLSLFFSFLYYLQLLYECLLSINAQLSQTFIYDNTPFFLFFFLLFNMETGVGV